MLKCGFYEGDITSNIGDVLPGGFGGRLSTMVRDKLYVSAFAVQVDEATSITLILDALMVEEEEANAIKKGVSEQLNLPLEAINVSAIHTHGGGPLVSLYNDVKDPAYCKFVVTRAIDAGVMAYKNLAEARIGVSKKEVQGVSYSRRYLGKDGKVHNNPKRQSPDIIGPIDDVDRELTVIRIDYADGTPMGMISNFALHPAMAHAIEPCGITADFPGVIRRCIKKELGAEFPFMFMQGASGNVNQRNAMGPKSESKGYIEIGEILAKETLELFGSTSTKDAEVLKVVSSGFVGRTKRPTEELINTLCVSDYTKNEMRKAILLPNEDVEVQVTSVQIGDLLIHYLPGEYFGFFSLYLKEHSICEHTIICELSNKKIGYICTREARKMGGYDASPSTYIIMDENAGDQVLDAVKENMKKL